MEPEINLLHCHGLKCLAGQAADPGQDGSYCHSVNLFSVRASIVGDHGFICFLKEALKAVTECSGCYRNLLFHKQGEIQPCYP